MTQDRRTAGSSDGGPSDGGNAQSWRSRWRSATVLRRFSRRQATGMAELSVLVVAGSLITGLFVGDGLSRTAVDIADGVTWLTDDESGRVIQVNPATGQLEVSLEVATPGNDLSLGQYDNKLYVIDNTTGEMSAIDVSTLSRSGQRRVSTRGAAETMTDGETVFLVDRGVGKISAIDPLTGDELGMVWLEDEGLADATIDGTGTVWSLDAAGRLTTLRWSDTSLAFATEDSQQIDNSGPGSVLVGHEEGVTIFGPDSGIVYQVGTGHDVIATSADLLGEITAPRESRSDLTAAAAPESSTVVIVANDQVREVNVEGIGCADPGRPEVFHNRIYVPCLGEGKVIILDANGQAAGQTIMTPGSDDPELVIDDDNLLINAQGSDNAFVVKEDGSVATIVREDDNVPTITPQTADPALPTDEHPQASSPSPPSPVPSTPPANNPGKPADVSPSPPKDNGKDPGKNKDPDKDPGKGPTSSPSATVVPDPGPTTGPTPTVTAAPTTANPTPGTPNPGSPTPTIVTPTTPTPAAPSPTIPTPATPTPTIASPTTPTPANPTPTTPTATTPTATPTPTPTTTTPTTPTPTPTTPAPTASTPTGVTASTVSATQVRVDWAYSGATPDDFVITKVGAGRVATVAGGQRQAVVIVTPGQASSFVVTANLGASSASSTESNTVTTSGAPGAPATVTSSSTWGGSYKITRFIVNVNWTAAPDNGSPITGYRVDVTTTYDDGSGGGGTYTVGPDVRSQRHTESCYNADPAAECSFGASYSVTVTAINALGDGPATTDTGSQAAPPPSLPAGGTDLVSAENINWTGASYEGMGTLNVSLTPPADWASFLGTCSYTASGSGFPNGLVTGAIACGATSLSLDVNHGIVRSPSGGQVSHSYAIIFTADNGVSSVDSARHNGSYSGGSLCNTCQIP